jgi:hypothetical protein
MKGRPKTGELKPERGRGREKVQNAECRMQNAKLRKGSHEEGAKGEGVESGDRKAEPEVKPEIGRRGDQT